MEINNGITDREREEVIAEINKMYNIAADRLKKATGKDAYIYAIGEMQALEVVRSFLKKRWQV